jgi:hypothetical protein
MNFKCKGMFHNESNLQKIVTTNKEIPIIYYCLSCNKYFKKEVER